MGLGVYKFFLRGKRYYYKKMNVRDINYGIVIILL